MSLNNFVDNSNKPWFNICVNNITIQDDFGYKEAQEVVNGTLKLNNLLEANWVEKDDLVGVYNNQCDLLLLGKTYSVNNENILFSDFKYSPPSYYNLSADKRTLLISSEGFYLVIFTFLTLDTNKTAQFSVFANDVEILESRVRFIPTIVAPGATDQMTTCTSQCVLTAVGLTSLQIRISPSSPITLNSRGCVVSVIKLTNFP